VLLSRFKILYIIIKEYKSLIRLTSIFTKFYFLVSRNKFIIQEVVYLKFGVKAML